MDPKKQPGIQFAQMYLGAAEFSHRSDALEFAPNHAFPDLTFRIEAEVLQPQNESAAAIRFRMASNPSPDAQYSIMVEWVAVIQAIPGEENVSPREYALHFAPAALFPFIRETIANLTSRGRFGPVFLKPMNLTIASLEQVPSGSPPASRVAAG